MLFRPNTPYLHSSLVKFILNILTIVLTNFSYFLFIYFQLFQSNPELMINIYCATHLIGMTSTCTNPILYAFFNENLRREFEFLAEFILPNALYRSQNTSQRSIKSNVGGDAIENGGNRKNPLQNLKPRRATEAVLYGNENQIMESDQLPTVHNESEENKENCDCFIPNAKSGFDNNFEMANF